MKVALKLWIVSSVIISITGVLLAQPEISESDRKAIWAVLDELGQAIVRKDLDSIMSRLSPNMDREKYNKIYKIIKEKFDSYDYTEYKFSPPAYRKIEILEPGKKVKFKVRYSEKYRGPTVSGSTSGLTSNFVMEKIDGKWLILDTDFYTKENAIKILGVIIGFFVLSGIALFIFWLWMLIDCIKRDFTKSNDKIVWILVIIFTQIIGAIIYYFVVKKKSR